MAMTIMEKIVEHLFYMHPPLDDVCDTIQAFQEFSTVELLVSTGKMKNNKAPGAGCIPAEISKDVVPKKYIL